MTDIFTHEHAEEKKYIKNNRIIPSPGKSMSRLGLKKEIMTDNGEDKVR